jgi:hypothetical protein
MGEIIMGVLSDVLQYKARKEAEQAQAANAIPQAVAAFIQGRQQQVENQQKDMLLKINAANAGYAIDPSGQLVLDTQSPVYQKSVLDAVYKQSQMERNNQYIDTQKKKEDLMTQMLNGEGKFTQDPKQVLADAATKSGYGEEDFYVKPMNKIVAGVPHTAYVPELKKELPVGLEKEFRGFTKTELGLEQNLRLLKENPEIEKEMNAMNPKAMRGGTLLGNIGQLMLKLDPKSKDFATFKAETDKVFQSFRKETTGAQAALAELGWLAPDYPETTDNPELYKSKAAEAIRRIQEGKQLLLDTWGTNYRTSQLRKVDSPKQTVEKGTNKVGRFTVEVS